MDMLVEFRHGRLDTLEEPTILKEKECETKEEVEAFIDKYESYTRYKEVYILVTP